MHQIFNELMNSIRIDITICMHMYACVTICMYVTTCIYVYVCMSTHSQKLFNFGQADCLDKDTTYTHTQCNIVTYR